MRRRFLLLLIIIPILLFVVKLFIKPHDPSKVAGISSSRELLSPLAKFNPVDEKLLEKAVQAQLTGTTGKYGIAVLNLKNNDSYFLNEHRKYKTGSLYKLWVMAVALEQIKKGTLRENDILSQDKDELYKKFGIDTPAPSGEAISPAPTLTEEEKEANKITFSVGEAIEQMIIISDNDAALLLSERIRLINATSFLEKNSFSESKLGAASGYPTTTPYDIALFLKKLYKGELADKEYTEKMLTLLKRQRLNGKLPKYLPEGTVIAHKTGELDEFTHDAGIVYTQTGDYIIVVLSESDARAQAEERISNVSKAVYEYFTQAEEQ